MLKKPLLAATIDAVEEFNKLAYPVWVSPKIDGVRCLLDDHGLPYSRAGKRFFSPLIPLYFQRLQDEFSLDMSGWDGELGMGVPGTPEFFTQTSAWLRTKKNPKPPEQIITFYHFDVMEQKSYNDRFFDTSAHGPFEFENLRVEQLQQYLCNKPEDVLEYEQQFFEQRYEGIIVRSKADMLPYKHGRATFNSGELYKYKRFADAEGVIVRFVAENNNQNEATTDEFGHTTRSKSKSGLVPKNQVGKMYLQSPLFKEEVEIGTGIGLTNEFRKEMWENQDQFIGRIVTFQYQPGSDYVKARFPSFKGFRDEGM